MSISLNFSPAGELLEWNEAAERLLGWSGREPGSCRLIDLVDREDRAAARRLLQDVRTEGSTSAALGLRYAPERAASYQLEATTVRRDGETVLAVRGEPELAVRSADREEHLTGLQLGEMIQAVEDVAIFLLDARGLVVSWNEGARTIKGYREEEIVGRPIAIFYTEEDRVDERPQRLLEEAERTGQAVDETWRVRKDGTRFWAKVTITAHKAEDGEIRGFVKVTRDLTERRRREKTLQVQKRETERANRILHLVELTASRANEAESLAEMLPVVLEKLRSSGGWALAHVYRRGSEDENEWVPTDVWSPATAGRFERLRDRTRETVIPSEILPLGEGSRRGEPLWDLEPDRALTGGRASPAREAGLERVDLVPVLEQGKAVALLEFFAERSVDVDRRIQEAVPSVQSQLARVAERARAREMLARSERRYRLLFENAQDGIAITGRDGTIVDANPAACRMTGFSKEELLDMATEELYVDPSRRRQLRRRIVREGRIRNVEARIRTKDEREIIVQISATMHRGPDGEVAGYHGFFRDVTDQKRAERALRESEEKFRALAEQSPIGIGLVQDGVMVYLNPAYAEIFGYEREELQGAPYTRFVHDDEVERVRDKVARRTSGEVDRVQYEFRGLTREGEERIIQVNGTAIAYQGEPAVIGTVMDITDRRRLQRELLEVQEEERRSIGRDLHDSISSQLSGAAMLAGSVRRTIAEHSEGAERDLETVIDLIQDAGDHSWTLARGLYPTRLDEEGLIPALTGLAHEEGEKHDVQIEYVGPEEIPVLEGRSADHLYWIAQEAVTNARKYAGACRVVVRLDASGDCLLLEVRDGGRGFDYSEQRDSGLGLRTMRYRCELIGADLTIDSEPGEGTTVRCRYPVQASQGRADAVEDEG